jgi:hypothetical protein
MYDSSYNTRNTEFREKLRAFLEPTSTRIVLVVILVILFLVLPIALGVYNSRFSASVKLIVAPSDAKIKIGEKVARPGDTVRLEPGDYTVIITRTGFFSYAEEVTLAEGDEKAVFTALESSDESTANWYLEHPEDDSIAAGVVSEKVNQESEEYVKKYPIASALPIFEDFYRIDYGLCKATDDEFCIFITALAGARSTAANRLMGLSGYDPAEYHIEYQQYVNPFGSVSASPNGSGVSISDLTGARAVLESLISPYNAEGYSFTVESVDTANEKYPSYAIGKVIHHISDGSINTYKVILQLQEGGWKIVAAPRLVYSYLDYPNLPREVIFRANH